MNTLKPWTYGPFELILHAELHFREGGDFDRRVAMIGFDNSVEVSITTYLSLHPIQRANRQYSNDDIKQWLKNYYTKLDFMEHEAAKREMNLDVPKDEIAWYHKIRNGQYHGGIAGVPDDRSLTGIRRAAICVFSILFEMDNVEEILEIAIKDRTKKVEEKPQRDSTLDQLLDIDSEVITIAGQSYPLSEALFTTDPDAYFAELGSIETSRDFLDELKDRYPNYVRNELTALQFVHYSDKSYLKTIDIEGNITLDDMGFIAKGVDDSDMFSVINSADKNATKFIEQLDPYSIIVCTNLFNEESVEYISATQKLKEKQRE